MLEHDKDQEQSKDTQYMMEVYGEDQAKENGDEPVAPPEVQEDVDVDLFGNPIDKPGAKKVEAEKPKDKTKRYDTEYICLVYDKRIPVPEDGLTLEKIRSFLEMEYPQFSKDRTEMLVDDKQKYIIPNVTKAPKKG